MAARKQDLERIEILEKQLATVRRQLELSREECYTSKRLVEVLVEVLVEQYQPDHETLRLFNLEARKR